LESHNSFAHSSTLDYQQSLFSGIREQDKRTLFIFDDCDAFLVENKVSFESNVKHLMKNIEKNCLIFISKNSLDVDSQINKFAIKPYNIMDSNLIYTKISETDNLNILMKVLDLSSEQRDRI